MPDATPSIAPLCFVLMPFGPKRDPRGGPDIDFDRIYETAIKPALEDAGMEPLRADLERTGGIIHKAMFERLLLCDYAVADLTTANANVFYELGVRHATRPRTTITIFAGAHELPFDVRYLRSFPYSLGDGNAFGDEHAEELRKGLTHKLKTARELAVADAAADSPLFQLLQGYQAPELAHLVTDTFRDRARYSEALRQRLRDARRSPQAEAALKAIQGELAAHLDVVEPAGLIDLYLSYRAVKAYEAMVSLYWILPVELQRTVVAREQLAFAYNRLGDSDRALDLLEAIENERGSNPETCGLLGRIHKDRWAATRASSPVEAAGHLDAALDAYTRGYQADWRDFYPGINVLSLLEVRGAPEDLKRQERLLPMIEYAVERHLTEAKPGYWEHATELELAVLRSDRDRAERALRRTLASPHETWQRETTLNSIVILRDARRSRGEDTEWLDDIAKALSRQS